MNATLMTIALLVGAAEPGVLCFSDAECEAGSRCKRAEDGRRRCDAPSASERAERLRRERTEAEPKKPRRPRVEERSIGPECTGLILGATFGACGGGLLGVSVLAAGVSFGISFVNLTLLLVVPVVGAALGAIGGGCLGFSLGKAQRRTDVRDDYRISQAWPDRPMAY